MAGLSANIFGNISVEERASLGNFMGNMEGKYCDKTLNMHNIGSVYKDILTLHNFSFAVYMDVMPNSFLLNFLLGFSGLTKHSANNKQRFQVGIILESLQSIRKVELIGPLCFVLNMNNYSMTSIKQATDVLGTVLPGGKYHCISLWLTEQATEAPKCPEGDLIAMFDNEQIIGRSWNIQPRNKVKMSITTNVLVVPLNSKSTIQNRTDLHPNKWMATTRNENAIQRIINGDKPPAYDMTVQDPLGYSDQQTNIDIHCVQVNEFICNRPSYIRTV